MLWVIFIVLLICFLWIGVRSKVKTKREVIQSPSIIIKTSLLSSDKIDTGEVIPSDDKGWILNPKATFPLTIYGVDKEIAVKIKEMLDRGLSEGLYKVTSSIVPIVARYNIRCKEIDDYVRKFKPIYLKKIEEQIKNSPEWEKGSDLDRKDLLSEFKENAIASLEIRPYCNIGVLFEGDTLDLTIDDILIDRYGYDTIQFYLRRKKGVHIVPAEDSNRKMFEKLANVGLAKRGEDIPLEAILWSLKLKELSALVQDLDYPKFSTKAKAIEFLLNIPDIRERLSQVVSFRSLFYLPPSIEEFKDIDLEKVSLSWQYAEEVSSLIVHTYTMAAYATRNYYQFKEYRSLSHIKGWKVLPAQDEKLCYYCREIASKEFPITQYPRVPLHIGCRCSVSPVTNDEG